MISDSQNNFGQWNVRIRTVPGRDDRGRPLAAAPQELLDLFAVTDGPDALLGHIIVTAQKFDPEEVDVLEMSRYTGVLRASAFTGDQVELSGVGLIWHLGDLDGYKVISTEIDLDTEGFEDGINLILPPAIEAGDIVPEVGAESARYLYVTYRSALEDWLSLFAAEYYLTPQGRLNAGTAASLFPSFNNPTTFIIRKGTGIDPNLRPLPLSSLTLAGDASDFATEVVSLVQVEDESFIEGGASGATAKRDLHGNLLDITIVNNETSTIAQNVDARAAARLAQAQSPQTSVELSTENYDVHGEFRPGDAVWVYDKASGAHDMANEVEFRGDTYWPIKLRVLAITYPVVEGMGVYFKHPVSGEIYDLTPYAVWEPAGSSQIEVAAFTRSLLPPSSGGIGGVIAPVVNPGAPPGIPDPPSVFGDERTLFVVVPTTTGGGSPQPSNVTTMRVYASTSSGFTPGPTNYIGSIPVSKANISLGQNVRGAFEWFDTALTYVRVSGVNTVEGPASAEVSDAATLIESAAILSLVADKIDAGTISASVEMTAALITGGTINGGDINGGTITGGTVNGTTINGGDIIGTTITGGTVQTASSGQRVALSEGWSDQIRFYTGDAAETNFGQVGGYVSGAGGSRRAVQYSRSPSLGGDWMLMLLTSESVDGTFPANATLSVRDQSDLDLTKIVLAPDRFDVDFGTGYWAATTSGIDLSHDLGGRIYVDDYVELISGGAIKAQFTPTLCSLTNNTIELQASGSTARMRSSGNNSAVQCNLNSVTARNYANSAYINMDAAAFIVGSDPKLKTNVREFAGDAAAGLKRAKVRRYRLKGGTQEDRLGLMADELPTDLITAMHRDDGGTDLGVDLYAAIAYGWAVDQQLLARIEALEADGAGAGE